MNRNEVRFTDEKLENENINQHKSDKSDKGIIYSRI